MQVPPKNQRRELVNITANERAGNLTEYLNDPAVALPPALIASSLAWQAVSWLVSHNGATFNLYFGNMAGQSLYAVSLYPERSVVISGGTIPEELLQKFIEDNQDLLVDPRNSIGLWYSETLQAVYLDVSVTLPDKTEAVTLGERYNQEAIYDLSRDEVLDTGGTGEWLEGWASEAERLPSLPRTQKRSTS